MKQDTGKHMNMKGLALFLRIPVLRTVNIILKVDHFMMAFMRTGGFPICFRDEIEK
jgi:hypothetical protein